MNCKSIFIAIFALFVSMASSRAASLYLVYAPSHSAAIHELGSILPSAFVIEDAGDTIYFDMETSLSAIQPETWKFPDFRIDEAGRVIFSLLDHKQPSNSIALVIGRISGKSSDAKRVVHFAGRATPVTLVEVILNPALILNVDSSAKVSRTVPCGFFGTTCVEEFRKSTVTIAHRTTNDQIRIDADNDAVSPKHFDKVYVVDANFSATR